MAVRVPQSVGGKAAEIALMPLCLGQVAWAIFICVIRLTWRATKKSSNTQFRFGFRLNVTLIWINGSAKSAEGLGNAIFNGSLGRACWPRPRWQVGISDSSSRGRIKPTMAGNLLWAFRSLSNYASIDSTSQLSWQTIPLRGARTQSNWSDSSEIDARTTWRRMVDEAAVRIWARLPISGHKLWAIV